MSRRRRPDAPARPRHVCAAHGCSCPIDRRRFMCARHWDRLPRYLRRALTLADRGDPAVGAPPSDDYLRAASEAIKLAARADGSSVETTAFDRELARRAEAAQAGVSQNPPRNAAASTHGD